MGSFDSFMPVKLISGPGCVVKNADVFRGLGARAMIVTGAGSAKKCGALVDCAAALEKCGVAYEVFDGITQNPYTADCFRCAREAHGSGADFVIGIGGGSPMDAAKAVAIYLNNPDFSDPADIYEKPHGPVRYPLALIGTTAGTGSEVTGVSVLTDSRDGRKRSVHGPDCYAAVSFCDSGYTALMPRSVTVSTALDAFAHAAESYFASTGSLLSRTYAAKALELVLPELCGMRGGESGLSRDRLYDASIFAGLAINITGTCFPHTLGYVLTEVYNVPHGRACTAFAPAFLERAGEYRPDLVPGFIDAVGMSVEELCGLIRDLTDVRIAATAADIQKFYPRWEGKINSFVHSPGGFTADDAAKVFACV